MLFDSHAHYDSEDFDSDREELLRSLPDKGVSGVVNPGCDGQSSRLALALAERYDYLYAAVGWHPQEWESWGEQSLEEIRALAAHPKAVAIGEIGLDYYWDKTHKTLQNEIFDRQIHLALELGKPVCVHDRNAHEDCVTAVLRYPELRGMFHCFSGSPEMAKTLLSRGWYLGFDGPVTYKNARRSLEVAAVTPLDKILLETDSPYLTPEPFRGRRNDSSMLRYIADTLAEVKGISPRELEIAAERNARRLFGLS